MTPDEALEFADQARAPELGLNDYEFRALGVLAAELRRHRETLSKVREAWRKLDDATLFSQLDEIDALLKVKP